MEDRRTKKPFATAISNRGSSGRKWKEKSKKQKKKKDKDKMMMMDEVGTKQRFRHTSNQYEVCMWRC